MSDWAVVLEFSVVGDDLAITTVDRLVQALSAYRASALHNDDRYALQVVVADDSPLFALQQAIAIHAAALDRLDMPERALVRAEIMTLAELESSWAAEAAERVMNQSI